MNPLMNWYPDGDPDGESYDELSVLPPGDDARLDCLDGFIVIGCDTGVSELVFVVLFVDCCCDDSEDDDDDDDESGDDKSSFWVVYVMFVVLVVVLVVMGDENELEDDDAEDVDDWDWD